LQLLSEVSHFEGCDFFCGEHAHVFDPFPARGQFDEPMGKVQGNQSFRVLDCICSNARLTQQTFGWCADLLKQTDEGIERTGSREGDAAA
ncbi:MAG: hypothetical protein P8Z78_15615, partial [Gammaproteobacteria bacterium]